MTTDDPITPEYRRMMNEVARALDMAFNDEGKPKKVGFALLVFEYGKNDGNRANYISNGASRKDMAKLFRETADRWEKDGTA